MTQRQTLICTGFEHGGTSVGVSPAKAFRSASGTWGIQVAPDLGGDRFLRLQPGASAAYVQLFQDAATGWPGVGAFRFRFTVLPSTDLVIVLETGTVGVPAGWGFRFDAGTGGIRPFAHDGTNFTAQGAPSAAIQAGVIYRVEFAVTGSMGTSGNAITIDWGLAVEDGPAVAQTAFAFTWPATTGLGSGLFLGNRVGPTSACTLDIDDVLYCYNDGTRPAYPIGPLRVIGLVPVAEGADASPADFTDSGGSSPPAADAWTYVDEVPWGDSATNDHVYQDTANAASWLEVALTDPPAQASDVHGAVLRATYSYPSTSVSANARVDAHEPGGTAYVDGLGLGATLAANNVTWIRVGLRRSANADITLPLIAGTVLRIGKSTNVAVPIRVHTAGIEVAFAWGAQRSGWGIILA
jgi:hypothetical protein